MRKSRTARSSSSRLVASTGPSRKAETAATRQVPIERSDTAAVRGDAGTLYFTTPAGALAVGDFRRAEAAGSCC
ncbi:hypothetical protein ACGF07_34335 [Kitasatospora sp. NPDC048194]|uniref:hypothetical protein n=1 Tax=Kitasatospora sp. NPDC048194 TaxID=3364045 RepID=UPI00371D6470